MLGTPSRWKAAAAALAIVAVTAGLQWALQPLVGSRVPFVWFYPAVAIAALWLGWRAALFVLLAGCLNAFYSPGLGGSLRVGQPADRISVAAYLISGGVLLALASRFHALRARTLAAESSLAGKVRDLQALQELGGRVMSIADLGNQLHAILATLCKLVDADKGLVSLFDQETQRLRATAALGFSAEGVRTIEALEVGDGAWGAAFRERRTSVVEDIEQDARFAAFREFARSEGFRSVHSRPLVNMQGEVFGVLSLHFAQPTRRTAREDQLANLCTQMASVLAERHLLLTEAMQLSRQVEIALESSAVPFCQVHPVRDEQGALVDMRWEYLNGAARRALSFGDEELVGRSARETFPNAWKEPGFIRQLDRALHSGRTHEFEMQVQTAPAKPWFRVIASPCERGLAMWFSNITQRKRSEEQLRDADRRKDEFLATLAHELRNPLAPIRQATVIVRSPTAKPEQQRWGLEVIDRQVAHMAVLLDDLLDVSRITRGKLELRRAPTDMKQVVDAALEAARPGFEMRDQHLHVHWPARPLWADVDPMRMSQVVGNLLTNASKYTPAGGSVWLEGREEDGRAVVSVRDTGVGIPPDKLDSVFEMFTQLRNPQSHTTVGLGIGLALARGLAQMHGATLTAHSEGPGRGSTFTLSVPLCPAPRLAGEVQRTGSAAGSARRVLVADDNRDAAESLAEVLRMHGHQVTLAFDGPQALAAFMETQPDVALLDIGMPQMSGNEVATTIRALPGGDSAVLVAITGWGQERDRAAARDAGFDFHFTKPVNPEQLLALVGNPQRATIATPAS